MLDLIRLTMVPGVGPKTCRTLIERFGSAGKVLDAPEASLRDVPGVGPKLAVLVTRARREVDASAEWELCRRSGVRVVARGGDGYPSPLGDIPDPPSLLYIRGTIEPADQLAIALVGSRKSTPYGERIAGRLATSLARVGLTVVSGLARGIDAAAHRGALSVGGRTIAVLANGLGEIYPPEHDELAREVAASGALISESPMGQSPLAGLFPQRNRIISGLSLGVVVVEATPRSGSLSTARHAVDQNREVFAVPGPVDSLPSRGCHALIRDGAKLVETVDDILEELGPLVREVKASAEQPAIRHPAELSLSDQERTLLGKLDDRGVAIDDLIASTGLTASQVMATLSVLELRRLVRRLPGPRFGPRLMVGTTHHYHEEGANLGPIPGVLHCSRSGNSRNGPASGVAFSARSPHNVKSLRLAGLELGCIGGAIDSRETESVERQGMPEVTITLESHDEELAVFGSRDQFLRQVRDAFGVKLVARHGEVRVEGDSRRVEQAARSSRN